MIRTRRTELRTGHHLIARVMDDGNTIGARDSITSPALLVGNGKEVEFLCFPKSFCVGIMDY